jgi:hypothetical protein
VKLWPRRQEQQPEPVARDKAWQEILHRYRTHGSRPLNLELYHRQARERQQQANATLRPPPPPKKTRRVDSAGYPPASALPSDPGVPAFDTPALDAPGATLLSLSDEEEHARLQRRFMNGGREKYSW